MKYISMVLVGVVALIAAGCASSPGDRIEKNSALVATWPADVQTKVRAGEIAVGFTPDQVRVALGDPDRTLSRTEAVGAHELWIYFDHSPKFSIGIGVGGGGGGTRVGGGVGVSNAGRGDPERLRVIFEAGRVSAIEQVKK